VLLGGIGCVGAGCFDTWTATPIPAGLIIGPNSVAVTSGGTHAIFVGAMWSAGLWRYDEP
jgi:hypothetical protein